MKKIQYKVGDHVVAGKCNIEEIHHSTGGIGVIVDIIEWLDYPYCIKFDRDPHLQIWCEVLGYADEPVGGSMIKNVIFNNPATIVQWSDGTKTVVKCRGEEFDPEKGMAMAIAKKMLGDHYWDEFQKWNVYAKFTAPKAPEKPKKSKYLNGKVVCVKTPYPWWTVGKVYDVVDGIITANDGDRYPAFDEPYVDYADVRHAGCANGTKHNLKNTFVPLEEYKNPLILKQIKAMDGEKIWLSSMFKYEEGFHDGSCGWYKVYVKSNRLVADDGRWYYITESYKSRNGYKAYYNDMSKEK